MISSFQSSICTSSNCLFSFQSHPKLRAGRANVGMTTDCHNLTDSRNTIEYTTTEILKGPLPSLTIFRDPPLYYFNKDGTAGRLPAKKKKTPSMFFTLLSWTFWHLEWQWKKKWLIKFDHGEILEWNILKYKNLKAVECEDGLIFQHSYMTGQLFKKTFNTGDNVVAFFFLPTHRTKHRKTQIFHDSFRIEFIFHSKYIPMNINQTHMLPMAIRKKKDWFE